MSQIAQSPEAMFELGKLAGETASTGDTYALIGGLGAGKTHWTKGFVAGIGSKAEVTSPTFGLVHEYAGGRHKVFHFDFYRLKTADELYDLGWDEYIDADAIVIAEWGDLFPEAFPEGTIKLHFTVEADGSRSLQQ